MAVDSNFTVTLALAAVSIAAFSFQTNTKNVPTEFWNTANRPPSYELVPAGKPVTEISNWPGVNVCLFCPLSPVKAYIDLSVIAAGYGLCAVPSKSPTCGENPE